MKGQEGPFPPDILQEIKSYPGNNLCCDCGSFDTDWASVSYGILLCLRCSGFHRSLGVHVSFVRSISLDTWSPKQIQAMKISSNFQMQEYFRRQRISNTDIKVRYNSKAAAIYRKTLIEAIDKGMRMESIVGKGAQNPIAKVQHGEKQHFSSLPSSPTKVSSYQHESVRPSSCRDDSSGEETIYEVHITAEDPSIGISIQKDKVNGRAKVFRVDPGGPAFRAGVQSGDDLVGLGGRMLDSYSEIMSLLLKLERPLRLVFRRYGKYHQTAPEKTRPGIPRERRASSHLLPNTKRDGSSSSMSSSSSECEDQSSAEKSSSSSHSSEEDSRRRRRRRSSNQKHNTTLPAADHNGTSDSDEVVNNRKVGRLETEVRQVSLQREEHDEQEKLAERPEKPVTDQGITKGSRIYVRAEGGERRWRSAIVVRFHRTKSPVNGKHLLKVQYRNGTMEEFVDQEDVSLGLPPSDDDLRGNGGSNNSQHTAPVSNGKKNKEEDPPPPPPDKPPEVSQQEYPGSTLYSTPLHDKRDQQQQDEEPPQERASTDVQFRSYEITFHEGSLGFTLSKTRQGAAIVTKLSPVGQAIVGGVRLGDAVISLNGQPVELYDQIMIEFPQLSRPLRVGFCGKSVQREGLGGDEETTTNTRAVDSSRDPGHREYSRKSSAHALSTKVPLGLKPHSKEFDVTFTEAALGMRLDEKAVKGLEGLKYTSVIIHVVEGGAAQRQGIQEGCVVVGINGEKYISHAHTVATLKHGKRPVTVRLRRPSDESLNK